MLCYRMRRFCYSTNHRDFFLIVSSPIAAAAAEASLAAAAAEAPLAAVAAEALLAAAACSSNKPASDGTMVPRPATTRL